jgi:hypothetical protein
MDIPTSDRFGRRTPVIWVIVAVLVALNFWYDYHHPLGIILDVIAAVVLLIWCFGKSIKRQSGGEFGSVETNRKVEKAAIELVTRRYEQDGSVGNQSQWRVFVLWRDDAGRRSV